MVLAKYSGCGKQVVTCVSFGEVMANFVAHLSWVCVAGSQMIQEGFHGWRMEESRFQAEEMYRFSAECGGEKSGEKIYGSILVDFAFRSIWTMFSSLWGIKAATQCELCFTKMF